MIDLYEEYYDPENDTDFTEDGDSEYDEVVGEQFAKDMFDFLSAIIELSGIVVEDFTSDRNFRTHFGKHCIGHTRNRRSTGTSIYYDFTDNSQYADYEKKISEYIANTDYIIDSLEDYDTIIAYMRKLFEGNCTVTFAKSCGLRGNRGPISLSFSSYSSDVTTNYGTGNTIDVCIKGRGNKTVTLYAVDAHKVQNKLNSIIQADLQNNNINPFAFNND